MITVLAVGDIILDEPDPSRFFDGTRDTLATGDVVIGHVEVPHSTSTVQISTDVPAPPADPAHLKAMGAAGFDVATLAGNHVFDVGEQGIFDTIEACRAAGLATTGAGPSLDAARTPALVTTSGPTVAVLSYNAVGPRESWATSRKAGCAYVRVLTHYELDHASPGGPPEVFTFADPASLERMAADVGAARESADVVVVAFHKGVGHTPAAIAMYERPLAHAAVDAGASMVVAHHAHIMRGVEMYRGAPIYHGLGNFVTVTRALNPKGGESAERTTWARKRVELYGFAPDPDMPYYPFHPESRNTAIAACRFADDGTLAEAGLIPCWIDATGTPHVGEYPEVTGYIEDISRRAGLPTTFTPQNGRVVLSA
ncbi:CapA family protein [Cryptosporangium phraense]|uniref:CapA family protein n=1 Tax=Cryptosporangium phraense TaxID=2593070 RepID=A0A545ALA9_9ACTN|nr:CapA family protein [Cryptosporangium phraense]TQS42096.1 CapA family protein [Cryptosporangium phraense]